MAWSLAWSLLRLRMNEKMLTTTMRIGRGIAATMAKLEKLAVLAKRKTLFDDKPTEINQLTFIIKQGAITLSLDCRRASIPCTRCANMSP